MTEAPELLPCPFCDCANVTDRWVRDGRQMFCQGCGASVAPSYHGPNNDTIERAKTAWNRRARIPAAKPVGVEGLTSPEAIKNLIGMVRAEAETWRWEPAHERDPVEEAGFLDVIANTLAALSAPGGEK